MRTLKSKFNFYNKKVLKSASSFFFPSFCLECSVATDHILCDSCLPLLTLIDPQTVQEEMQNNSPYITGLGSCFDYVGPIQKIVSAFKYADQPYLAKSLAAFLFLQFQELGWPKPDIITHVPQFFVRTKLRGYNQSECLAKELAELMNVTEKALLQKNEASFCQSMLSKKGRQENRDKAIGLKKEELAEDQIVLVIDDVYTTGSTIESVAKALALGYPKSIYVLTLCRVEN